MEIPLAALAEWCVPTDEEEGEQGRRTMKYRCQKTLLAALVPFFTPRCTTIPPTLGGGISYSLFFLQQLVNLLPELIVSVLDAFEERRTAETKHQRGNDNGDGQGDEQTTVVKP